MGKPGRTNLGFTLIEILLTMTILSMLMISGTLLYSYLSQNWERGKEHFSESEKAFTDWLLVMRAINATIPKLAHTDENVGFYFLGRDNGFTAVTASSVQNPMLSAVYRVFREEVDGGYILVYEEAMLTDTVLSYADQALPFSFRLELTDNEERVDFEYFGWGNLNERVADSTDLSGQYQERWFAEYDGLVRNQHPSVIQVLIGDFLLPIEIADTTNELLRLVADNDV